MNVRESILILGAASSYVDQAIDIAEESGYCVAAVVDNLGVPCAVARRDIPCHVLSALPEALRGLPAICCVGTPEYRRRVIREAREAGVSRFRTIVHPKAVTSHSARLHDGIMISALAYVGAQTTLGDHVLIRNLAYVGHNGAVADYVTISPGAVIGALVTIETGAYLALGSRVLPKVRVGANSIVAAGAVVIKDVPPNTLVAGVPAAVKKEGIPGYRG